MFDLISSVLLDTGTVPDKLSVLTDVPQFVAVLPQVSALAMQPRQGFQHKDVLRHTFMVVAAMPVDDLLGRWAALLHDIGKPATRRFHGAPGSKAAQVSFVAHEVVGARMVPQVAAQVGMAPEFAVRIQRLVAMHMRPRQVDGWTDAAVRRYMTDAGDVLDTLDRLARADVTSRFEKNHRRVARQMDLLAQRVAQVAVVDELAARRPPVDGLAVAAHLGIEPGPLLGVYMDALYARIRDDVTLLSVSEAFQIVDSLAAVLAAADSFPGPDSDSVPSDE